jgi:uncharacterized protein YcfJ
LLGNQVGGGKGRDLATIAGAVGGALAGNHIEGSQSGRLATRCALSMDQSVRTDKRRSGQPASRSRHLSNRPDVVINQPVP